MSFSKYGSRRPNYIHRDGDVYKNDGLMGYRKILSNGKLEKKYHTSNLKPIKRLNDEYK